MSCSKQEKTGPNILFIFNDDHCEQALSSYGSKIIQTPGMDRIANEGMRFNRCDVTRSIYGPSRAVIQTGMYSHMNGLKPIGIHSTGISKLSQNFCGLLVTRRR